MAKSDADIRADERIVTLARKKTMAPQKESDVPAPDDEEVVAQRRLMQKLKAEGSNTTDVRSLKEGLRRASKERLFLESLDETIRAKDLGPLLPPWESAFTADGEEFFIK